METFTADFVLLKSKDGILKDVVKGFNMSLGIEHIVKEVNCKKSFKVATFVTSWICDVRSKLSIELGKNYSCYKHLCRKLHLSSVIRMNIWTLNDKNKYQVSHSISDFCKLDNIMGCVTKWDIRLHVEDDLSLFFSVCE